MTIPTPTSFLAQSLHAIAQQLARCPTFQALTDAADPAGALARIILLDGGRYDDDEQATDPVASAIDGSTIALRDGMAWAHVAPTLPDQQATDTVWRSYQRAGSISLRLCLQPPAGHPAERLTWLLNQAGAIESEYLGTFAALDYLSHPAGGITTTLEPIPAVGSWAKDLRFVMFTIEWRDTP